MSLGPAQKPINATIDETIYPPMSKPKARSTLYRLIEAGQLARRALLVPLLDRNQGGIARARATVMRADANQSSSALRVEAEVRVALAEYRASYNAIIEGNEGLLRGAGEMRTGIRAAYTAGAKSLLEVLDAEQAFSDAMRLEIEEEAGYIRTYHLLNAAVGRAVLTSEP